MISQGKDNFSLENILKIYASSNTYSITLSQ
uniref:Uncharacterized protein n=1 Tax=Rhizophora mucronata TaxID=61149 RepID=A0A2P2PWW8_RHIMU